MLEHGRAGSSFFARQSPKVLGTPPGRQLRRGANLLRVVKLGKVEQGWNGRARRQGGHLDKVVGVGLARAAPQGVLEVSMGY